MGLSCNSLWVPTFVVNCQYNVVRFTFLISQLKHNVVGAQTNRLNETFFGTQKQVIFKVSGKKIISILPSNISLLDL